MKALVIHNVTAGEQELSRETLLKAVTRAGVSSISYQEMHELDLTHAHQAELIVIAGGDGTVAKVISKLPRGDQLISIVPLGTANNIARSLGLADRTRALEAIGGAARRPLDLACARWAGNVRMVIEGVGFGALATTMEAGSGADGSEKIAHGREALRQAVSVARPIGNSISVDGETLEGEWLFAEFLNVAFTGPALPLAPVSDTGDDALDLVLLAPERREAFCAWVAAPETGPPPIEHLRVGSAHISGECRFRLNDKQCRLGPDETLRIGFSGRVEIACND